MSATTAVRRPAVADRHDSAKGRCTSKAALEATQGRTAETGRHVPFAKCAKGQAPRKIENYHLYLFMHASALQASLVDEGVSNRIIEA